MKKTQIFDITLTSVFVAIILMMSLIQQLGFITILPGVAITLVHVPTLIGIFILKPKQGFILGVTFGIGSMLAALIYGAGPLDLAFQNPLVSVLPRAIFGIAAWATFYGLQKLSVLKNGKFIIFGVVVLISTFAIYFGSTQIAKNAIWNDYNTAVANQVTGEELQVIYDNAQALEVSVMNVLIPIVLVVIAGFITLYFILISSEKYSDLVVSSAFVVSTLIHTVLVLTALVLFGNVLQLAFGDAVTLIYSTAATNGLIEALAAVLIGTPVFIALKQLPQLQNRK